MAAIAQSSARTQSGEAHFGTHSSWARTPERLVHPCRHPKVSPRAEWSLGAGWGVCVWTGSQHRSRGPTPAPFPQAAAPTTRPSSVQFPVKAQCRRGDRAYPSRIPAQPQLPSSLLPSRPEKAAGAHGPGGASSPALRPRCHPAPSAPVAQLRPRAPAEAPPAGLTRYCGERPYSASCQSQGGTVESAPTAALSAGHSRACTPLLSEGRCHG